LRGGDPSSDLASVAPLQAQVSDPQFVSYGHFGHAWAALATGKLDDARSQAEAAAAATEFFHPIASPLGARAALWAGDRGAAQRILAALMASGYRGAALANDEATIQAGLAALDGRRAEALAAYREAIRTWRVLGLAFDEALAGIDMAILLDADEPEVRAAADSSREILTRLRARPLLERLDAALAQATAARAISGAATSGGATTARESTPDAITA
jgi:hypothetical protein